MFMKSLSGIAEVLIPASDLQASQSFYHTLGYETVAEHDWGMIQMSKESTPPISLINKQFFPNVSIGFLSDDLDHCVKSLEEQSIRISEDDRSSEPARIVFGDPDGLEIYIFEG
jgi:catechol 2,3-dioxygenase-like lactoylglutathione lyase family enzyme